MLQQSFFRRLSLIIFSAICCLNATAQDVKIVDHLAYIKVPDTIKDSDISEIEKEELIRSAMEALKKPEIQTQVKTNDLIIVFTDAKGNPFFKNEPLPQILNEDNDLSYTMYSPQQPWKRQDSIKLNGYISDLYPLIKKVVGSPSADITVNIRRDSTIPAAGYYFSDINEMLIRQANAPDVFCHESIHAFRDNYIMGVPVFEEGLTRAAEVAVFNLSAKYEGEFENHIYTYDMYYEGLNKPQIGSANGDIFGNITFPLLKYQLAGYAWGKLYLEDSTFFKRFNKNLFEKAAVANGILYSADSLRKFIFTITNSANGLPIKDWYALQHVLNHDSKAGYYLYQRLNQNTIDYFYRDISGNENPVSGAKIMYELTSHDQKIRKTGEDISTSYGWISVNPAPDFSDYKGRIRIIAGTESPAGPIRDTAFYAAGEGVFGLVEEQDTGSVLIKPLIPGGVEVLAPLVNGRFEVSSLRNYSGSFSVRFTYNNCDRFTRIYTKDSSDYFINVSRRNPRFISGPLVAATDILIQDDQICVPVAAGQFSFEWKKDGLQLNKNTSCILNMGAGYYEVEMTNLIDPCLKYKADLQVVITAAVNKEPDRNLNRVYPNPGRDGIFRISPNGNEHDCKVEVKDINGRLIFSDDRFESNSSVIDLSAHQDGLYIFTITSENNREFGKIIKGQ